MSGGRLDYFYSNLEEHAGDFEDAELDDLVRDLANLFYEREWFLSGDTNEGRWSEARDAFKAKWFTQHGRQERIEKYLDDMREKVFKSLGMSCKYCKTCAHWSASKEDDFPYGECDITHGCLMHRSESCDKWRSKDDNETKANQ